MSPKVVKQSKAAPVAPKPVVIDPTQQAFSVPQSAVYLGLTPWRVRMAVWEGRLTARKVGKSLLILRSDADRFLKDLPAVAANDAPWLQQRQAAKGAA